MSLMNKLADKLGDMMKDKKEDSQHNSGNEGHNYQSQPPPDGYSQHAYGQHSQSNTAGYQPTPYGQQGHFGARPPQGPPSSELPLGWFKEWDGNTQRYYYVEQATGHTQWEPPYNPNVRYGPPPSAPQHGYDQNRGMYGGAPGGYGGGYGHPGYPEHHKGKDGKGGMIAAGLGGATLGVIGGAVIAHEMTEENSDGEQHTTTVVHETHYADPAYTTPPAEIPEDASSSDVESIHEAQEDVLEAQNELDEASSESDREEAQEELEEAQEELEEEVEEAED